MFRSGVFRGPKGGCKKKNVFPGQQNTKYASVFRDFRKLKKHCYKGQTLESINFNDAISMPTNHHYRWTVDIIVHDNAIVIV